MRILLACLLFGVSSPATAAELLVACASDLAPTQPDLTAAFRRISGTSVRFVTGSSGMLARQIANGAPYDVFLSANQAYVDELVKNGSILSNTVKVYARGRLGLWPQSALQDLTHSGILHIAIANPKHAPYGLAAQQALERSGLWKSLQAKIVYGENVRQALQFAESGNADAVITSWTLLQGKGTLLSESLHEPILQAGGVVTTSKHRTAALHFLTFLTEGEGAALLRKFGLHQSSRN